MGRPNSSTYGDGTPVACLLEHFQPSVASGVPAASPCCVSLHRRCQGIGCFDFLAWLVPLGGPKGLSDGRFATQKLKTLQYHPQGAMQSFDCSFFSNPSSAYTLAGVRHPNSVGDADDCTTPAIVPGATAISVSAGTPCEYQFTIATKCAKPRYMRRHTLRRARTVTHRFAPPIDDLLLCEALLLRWA